MLRILDKLTLTFRAAVITSAMVVLFGSCLAAAQTKSSAQSTPSSSASSPVTAPATIPVQAPVEVPVITADHLIEYYRADAALARADAARTAAIKDMEAAVKPLIDDCGTSYSPAQDPSDPHKISRECRALPKTAPSASSVPGPVQTTKQ